MNKRLTLIAILTIALGIPAAHPGFAQQRRLPTPLIVNTRDSSTIYSDLYLPLDTSVAKFPLVVLMHMFDRDRTTFEKLVPLLLERNWAVLNVDLRGHGKSAVVRRRTILPQMLHTADFRMMPGDLFLLLAEIPKKTARVDTTQLAIIGASIGSSVGVMYGAKHPEVRAIVLVSPGLEYRKMNTEPYLAEYSRRPVLIMVGKYDSYSYQSSLTLESVALGEKKLVIYEKPKHGTELIEAVRGADSLIVDWLDAHF